jgi:hypothetical protein
MRNEEYQQLVKKAIKNAPDWLKEDLRQIEQQDAHMRISYVVSELYNKYTFGFKHVVTAMNQDTQWTLVSRQRLNFIDNNIDLIQHMIKEKDTAL